MITHLASGPVVVLGGYGVVGTELAQLIRHDRPEAALTIAGRHPDRGRELALELGAETVAWDVTRADQPCGPDGAPYGARAVIATVNDPGDITLRACLEAGVPYVDITRWTTRMQRAIAIVATRQASAPVVLSSGWMGGLVPRLVGALALTVGGAIDVDVAIRYDVADRAGVDSVDFLDRLDLPFEVLTPDGERAVFPLRDRRRVEVGRDWVRVARIDTPEQFTLPATLGVRSAVTRIGFSSPSVNRGLATLHRLGFFRLARGERLRGVRRKLLYQPGSGGEARILITVSGPSGTVAATVTDPRGQAHLTAVGALLSLRDALDAGAAGVRFPELSAPTDLPQTLATYGILVESVLNGSAQAPRAVS